MSEIGIETADKFVSDEDNKFTVTIKYVVDVSEGCSNCGKINEPYNVYYHDDAWFHNRLTYMLVVLLVSNLNIQKMRSMKLIPIRLKKGRLYV